MGLISANLLLRSMALLHALMGYVLITSPQQLLKNSFVFVLGESMKLPAARGFDVPSAATSFAGSVFILLAVSDFISIGNNDVSQRWWGMQAPVRLLFFFALTAWSYFAPSLGSGLKSSPLSSQGVGNNVVFTWSFLELGLWFWIYNGLMSEKQQRALWAAKERNAKIEMEGAD